MPRCHGVTRNSPCSPFLPQCRGRSSILRKGREDIIILTLQMTARTAKKRLAPKKGMNLNEEWLHPQYVTHIYMYIYLCILKEYDPPCKTSFLFTCSMVASQ